MAGGSSLFADHWPEVRDFSAHVSNVQLWTYWHSNIAHAPVPNVAQRLSESECEPSASVNANMTVEWI